MAFLIPALQGHFVERRLEALFADWRGRFGDCPIGLELWDGRRFALADRPSTLIRVNSPAALSRLLNPSLAAIGSAYVEGQIDFDGHIRDVFGSIAAFVARLGPAGVARRPTGRLLRRHTRRVDAESIAYHYDVSNAFYRLWLDRNMVYSCAYFRSESDSLERAQDQKIDHILTKIRLKPGERLLDIGCGWGALVIRAARDFGARCVGITLSRQQYDEARQRVEAAGLCEVCEIRLQDYRDLDERFDKVVSVGMYEHVGLRHLREYFAKIHALLPEGGIALNHGITASDPESGDTPFGGGDFIHRYVFPNGELPHIGLVLREMAAAGLESTDVESLRLHYARTLEQWTDRFEANGDRLRAIAGDRRFRIWRAYLAGCAYAFAQRWVSIHQIVTVKSAGPETYPLPLTRDYMYGGA